MKSYLKTALELAATIGMQELAEAVLETWVDVRTLNTIGQTAMQIAATNGNIKGCDYASICRRTK
jgi:hypothetical protein